MNINNVTGLEKPILKLIEVVSEGLGETANAVIGFDARKIKRIGLAEAEVEKNKIIKRAEGNAQAIEILYRASNRFSLEQYNKQINLENIIVGSRELLTGKEVSDEPVDKDWSFKFMNIAQDISRDDMQKLLSKILTEEIKNPNSFSLRTLDFVKNLSRKDLMLFRRIAIFSDNSLVFMTKANANEGFSGITYAEIMKMAEIGFIQPTLSTVYNMQNIKESSIFSINLKKGQFAFKFTKEKDKEVFPILSLSTIGSELAPLIEFCEDDIIAFDRYFEDLKEFWKLKDIEVVIIN